VALSYVWGAGSSTLQLQTSNLHMLARPGALRNVDAPNTIRDSMKLTASSGHRFLWVDALCIVQNDENDKAVNIADMRQIYTFAILTIVAATGDSSAAGLPRTRGTLRETSQDMPEVLPGLWLTAPLHLTDALDRSHYETRGWTYV
jgi:hypothetical protein